jgi:hypothetical protein
MRLSRVWMELGHDWASACTVLGACEAFKVSSFHLPTPATIVVTIDQLRDDPYQ